MEANTEIKGVPDIMSHFFKTLENHYFQNIKLIRIYYVICRNKKIYFKKYIFICFFFA